MSPHFIQTTIDRRPESCFMPQGLRIARRISIQQGQQSNLFTLLAQLLGHLERHDSSQRSPADKIWPAGLQLAHLFDVVRGHVFDPCVQGAFSIQAGGLKTIEGLVVAEMFCQLAILEHVATERVYAEERRVRSRLFSGSYRIDSN